MTDNKRQEISNDLLCHISGEGSVTKAYQYLLDVFGEDGALYVDMRVGEDDDELLEVVTQEEIGEAMAWMFKDHEFEIGGSKY